MGETDRPEYETLPAFGTMTLNADTESIIKCNHICNRYVLDTISLGATIAWAIECYENGLLSNLPMDCCRRGASGNRLWQMVRSKA